jgi:hypothetical protein
MNTVLSFVLSLVMRRERKSVKKVRGVLELTFVKTEAKEATPMTRKTGRVAS